ncbi:hypothetical protein KM043_013938 [Ampulex compressa]|nr:hypothetical protein KM043_013938 [Ampulex compressa]
MMLTWWFTLVLFAQFVMWSTSDHPPGVAVEPPTGEGIADIKETCERNKNELESLKEMMTRNKQSLRKKEEEVQEYARQLSKIKSRAKLLRRNKDVSRLHKTEENQEDRDEETSTPKGRTNLLQRKLAENRKAFEQRSKELTESKRAVEEKVEAIRQQLEEKNVPVNGPLPQLIVPLVPMTLTSDTASPVQVDCIEEKENTIVELNSKILKLEATVLDLQENLKEKDSVIESKTKAVTLMSADLSKRGKVTLDTLEDTKEEMRSMQEHFVLLETSLKGKNESLLEQLAERDARISVLEQALHEQGEDKRVAELEGLVDELKRAHRLLEDESKLQLHTMEEEYSRRIADLESQLHQVEDLHKQRTGLETVSEVNAELLELGNQVALLEEEKGNLQLSLVDFDELKGNWKERVTELESKVFTQAKEIQGHVEAITTLENQKLDLTQELHAARQEISALELENAEYENLRVTAEMKVVELEEQLETESRPEREELLRQLENLRQENEELYKKLSRLEEKASSDSGSTGSFEAIQEADKQDLIRKIEELSKKNEELTARLTKPEEKASSDTGSTESFERIPPEQIEEEKVKVEEMESSGIVRRIRRIEEPEEALREQLLEVTHQRDDLISKLEKILETRERMEKEEEARNKLIASLEQDIEVRGRSIAEQSSALEEMRMKLANKEQELQEKEKIMSHLETASAQQREALERDLKDARSELKEWRQKCSDMQEKIDQLEASKASVEKGLEQLRYENERLFEDIQKGNETNGLLNDRLKDLESKLQEVTDDLSSKEQQLVILHERFLQREQQLKEEQDRLTNLTVTLDSLQRELDSGNALLIEREALTNTLMGENEKLRLSLQRSKPLEEYNKLAESLANRSNLLEASEIQLKDALKEGVDLREKLNDLSAWEHNIKNELSKKMDQVADLESRLVEAEKEMTLQAERNWEQSLNLEKEGKYVEELRSELREVYRSLELVKEKHAEDQRMQNERIEGLLEESSSKAKEVEELKNLLTEKETAEAASRKKLELTEERMQAQVAKMRKIAATLKKKTVACQELETRVAELEEKWTTEKDEKEAKNKRIQEVEGAIGEKERRISELEVRLDVSLRENHESITVLEQLRKELSLASDKIFSLEKERAEVTQLRKELDSCCGDLLSEKQSREKLSEEYQLWRDRIALEEESKRVELEEVTEKARELSVRMEVMEKEYVEQLTLINHLKAENGLLVSKQAQIDERLEEVRKESEERQTMIETLQKEAASNAKEAVEEGRCERCEQCQALVQALEGRLQEREAEIENLDNELANSAANFAQMRQSLGEEQEKKEEKYNAILGELRTTLVEVTKENGELSDKLQYLETLNTTLQENLVEAEREKKESMSYTTELQTKLAQIVKENVELASELQVLKTDNASLQENLTTLDYEKKEDKSCSEELQAKLTQIVEENEKLIDKLEALESINSTLQENITMTEQKKKEAQFCAEELLTKLAWITKENEDMVEKLRALEALNTTLEENLMTMNQDKSCAEELRMKLILVTEENAKLFNHLKALNIILQENLTTISQEKSCCKQLCTKLAVAIMENEELAEKLQTFVPLDSTLQQENLTTVEMQIETRKSEEEEAPKLFDAVKIFGESLGEESQLQTQVEKLRTRVKELEEENGIAQTRSGKLVRKLKEYKLQVEKLQQQQQNAKLCDLDSAIEEELKLQVNNLETALREVEQERLRAVAEREALSKRLDMLTASNERHVQLKERLDMDLEVLRIQNQELLVKLRAQEEPKMLVKRSVEEQAEEEQQDNNDQDEKERNRIALQEEMNMVEALSKEKNQLEMLVQELRTREETIQEEYRVALLDSKEEYKILKREYEDCLKEAQERVNVMQEKSQEMEVVTSLRIQQFESENQELRKQLEEANVHIKNLTERLHNLEKERRFSTDSGPSVAEVTELLNARIQEVAELKLELQSQYVEQEEKEMELSERIKALNQEQEEIREKIEMSRHEKDEDKLVQQQNVEAIGVILNKATQTHTLSLESKEEEICDLSGWLSTLQDSNDQDFLEKQQDMTLLTEGNQMHICRLQRELRNLQAALMEKESKLNQIDLELQQNKNQCQESNNEIKLLSMELMIAVTQRDELNRQIQELTSELMDKNQRLLETAKALENKNALLETSNQKLEEKQAELEKLSKSSTYLEDELLAEVEDQNLRSELNTLKEEMEAKQEEIEHLKYVLSENTYPMLIQEMQDMLNCLYEEKAKIEAALEQACLEKGDSSSQLDDQKLVEERQKVLSELRKRDEEMEEVQERLKFLMEDKSRQENETQSLYTQLQEREIKIQELILLSEEKNKQLLELRAQAEAKEEELVTLKKHLKESVKDREAAPGSATLETPNTENVALASAMSERDVALYMLHQRDVRCEELTHELMQLLEERDTLQLRLSNAIRINEELRRTMTTMTTTKEDVPTEHVLPFELHEHAEVATEAVDNPSKEDGGDALALKLSQLQTVSHAKDVRLKDERELRHTQQMSLLAHKDVLSTLPPEAAARLVNANYTLSREVQSQSSVLLNWLWGKSTPKVLHM